MKEKKYVRDKRSPIPKSPTVSRVMSSIKGKNTKIELSFRKALYQNGARGYRINYKKLAGKPDIAFIKKKIIVFIHGCFWHGCEVCGGRIPKHNNEYWSNKLKKNIDRDARRRIELENAGFTVIEIWEHEINDDLKKTVRRTMKLLNKKNPKAN